MSYSTRRFISPPSILPSVLAVLASSSLASAQDEADEPTTATAVQVAQAEEATAAEAEAPPPAAAPAPPPAPEPAPPPEPAPEPEADPSDFQVNFGVGIRTQIDIDPNTNDDMTFGVVNNVRPYVSGQVHDNIKFEGNLDSNGQNIRVLDAVLKFEFSDYFNLWAGHFLPPTDRANLSGPYFQNAWNYPLGVHTYPSQYAGRDDGLAYWGQYEGGKVKWQVGMFNMGTPTPDPRFSARVVVNLLDPEPGYYNSSTYYGGKDVLAIGGVVHHQPGPDGAPSAASDTLWNLDFLYENSFPDTGTLNVEGAFYGFGGRDAGTSFSALVSFLLANQIGIGQLQPMARLQYASVSDGDTFEPIPGVAPPPASLTPLVSPGDGSASRTTIDVGLHYIISGHNARLAATFSHMSDSIGDADFTNTLFTLGGQIQVF